jgi:multisubunit Na+/H+ antiporter MnhB subunit
LLEAIREVQIPLLAAMLIGACLTKLSRVLRARSVDVVLGPTALFPLRLQRPVAMAMCATEMSLGIALLVTAGAPGAGLPAAAVRALTAVLFITATGALIELRQRRPDVGCGCFGDLSTTPVKLRTIARSALLALAAAVTVGVTPLRLLPPGDALALRLGLLAAEFGLIAALSPEIGEALVRLGYSEPCELRVLPVERTLAALCGSRVWRRHTPVITHDRPVDVWRELCWRYLVYPGRYAGREVEVVFAVYLRARRPMVRAAVVDSATGEVLPPPPARAGRYPYDRPAVPLPPHAVGVWPMVSRTAGAAPQAGPVPPPGSGRPPFLSAPVLADQAVFAGQADAPPGSLYNLLALSSQVPRERQNRQEVAHAARPPLAR